MDCSMGSHSLLQGIFSPQGSKPRLLRCRQIIHRLSRQGGLTVTASDLLTQSLLPVTVTLRSAGLTPGGSLH